MFNDGINFNKAQLRKVWAIIAITAFATVNITVVVTRHIITKRVLDPIEKEFNELKAEKALADKEIKSLKDFIYQFNAAQLKGNRDTSEPFRIPAEDLFVKK